MTPATNREEIDMDQEHRTLENELAAVVDAEFAPRQKQSAEQTAVNHARGVAAILNELMTRIPRFRVQSYGTRVSVQPASEHYYDTGLDCVAEFHNAFAIPPVLEPIEPALQGEARIDMMRYWIVAHQLGKQLKQYAGNARERGDANGNMLLLRIQLIQEELAELAEAMLDGSIVGCLDALTDLTYVVDGTYLATGLGHYKLAALEEVHRSNMSKLGPNGAILSDAGRVERGPDYSPPDLKMVLGMEED